MKDKMTEEQAKLYAALLWEELCKPEYYKSGGDGDDIKRGAKREMVKRGVIPDGPWSCTCPYCHMWHTVHHHCKPCPMQTFAPSAQTTACLRYGPYAKWDDNPSPESARAMADFCWSVYRGQDGSDKGRKACACCKGEEAKAVRFAVGDRVKLLDEAAGREEDPMWTYPKWNNTRVGGTVEDFNGIGGNPRVRWNNGHLSSLDRDYISPLTSAERLMLAQRPIRPGDVFKYWNDEELRTLVVVSDGDDDDDVVFYFLDVTDADSPFIATDGFDPDEEREVDDVACYHCPHLGYNVEFERLVPVGRMKWSVEPHTAK